MSAQPKGIVEKIKDFEEDVEKQVKDWKSKLTAGLDNTQLLISFGILGCFYFAYTMTNYSLRNTRDQYSIISGCHCRDEVQRLYRLWFYLFFAIWVTVHTCISLERGLKSLSSKCCGCNGGELMEAIRKCTRRWIYLKCKNLCSSCCCDGDGDLDAELEKQKRNIKHYERILWYRYYKLYVVGYSKEIKPQTKASSQDNNTAKGEGYTDNCIICSESKCYCCTLLCTWKFIRALFHVLLLLLKYIAQGATVPILMLQVFDTYALLCFSPENEYCNTTSEYEIHVAQAAITISFLFSIALAQLTSTLLEWNPGKLWSKKQLK